MTACIRRVHPTA